MKKLNQDNSKRGFTVFIAIVITATLLLVSTGIISVSVRQAFLTGSGRESQYAFYAADTGIECALYWDVKNPSGFSAFATSTGPTQINCNNDAQNPLNVRTVGGNLTGGVSTFDLTFLPDPYCVNVIVTKQPNGATKIESRGRNTCDTTSARRVERAVQVDY